jgi:excisionase family DNA binding protein
MNAEIPTDLISPREAAKLLRTGVSTVYRFIQDRRLRSWKRAHTRYLVSRREVLALFVEEVPPPLPSKRPRA